MRHLHRDAAAGKRLGLAGAAAAVLVVICCATLPLLAGLASGIAVGAAAGVGAGILVSIAVAAVMLTRRHRLREQERDGPPPE